MPSDSSTSCQPETYTIRTKAMQCPSGDHTTDSKLSPGRPKTLCACPPSESICQISWWPKSPRIKTTCVPSGETAPRAASSISLRGEPPNTDTRHKLGFSSSEATRVARTWLPSIDAPHAIQPLRRRSSTRPPPVRRASKDQSAEWRAFSGSLPPLLHGWLPGIGILFAPRFPQNGDSLPSLPVHPAVALRRHLSRGRNPP